MYKPNFGDDSEVEALISLSDTYHRLAHLNGPFVRLDKAYWQQWIKTETAAPNNHVYVLSNVNSFAPVAYITIGPKKRDDTALVVKDFCVNQSEFSKDRGQQSFQMLVSRILNSSISNLQPNPQFLIYPAALFLENIKGNQSSDYSILEETGMMYRLVKSDSPLLLTSTEQLVSLLHTAPASSIATSSFHVFWDVDAF